MSHDMERVSSRKVNRPNVASFISHSIAAVISFEIFHFQALGYLKAHLAHGLPNSQNRVAAESTTTHATSIGRRTSHSSGEGGAPLLPPICELMDVSAMFRTGSSPGSGRPRRRPWSPAPPAFRHCRSPGTACWHRPCARPLRRSSLRREFRRHNRRTACVSAPPT